MAEYDAIVAMLSARFPVSNVRQFRALQHVTIARTALHEALATLQTDCGFDMLADITCVDFLTYRDATDRFVVVYNLTNTESNQRLVVHVPVPEQDLCLPTVTDLWAGADWLEREVWDLFGIVFEGHPDLRRILLPAEFSGHPLRKDYPLQGRGERHNFPIITRDQS